MDDTLQVRDRADETVRRSIKALVEGRGFLREDVALAIGMPRSTFYAKLGGLGSKQAFRAGEVAQLAAFFGVPIADIYAGLGGVFVATDQPAVYAAAAA